MLGDVTPDPACSYATASWPLWRCWPSRAAAIRSSTCTCTPPANVGLTVNELREVLIQIAPYAGFPAAIDAMRRLQALEADEAADAVE